MVLTFCYMILSAKQWGNMYRDWVNCCVYIVKIIVPLDIELKMHIERRDKLHMKAVSVSLDICIWVLCLLSPKYYYSPLNPGNPDPDCWCWVFLVQLIVCLHKNRQHPGILGKIIDFIKSHSTKKYFRRYNMYTRGRCI